MDRTATAAAAWVAVKQSPPLVAGTQKTAKWQDRGASEPRMVFDGRGCVPSFTCDMRLRDLRAGLNGHACSGLSSRRTAAATRGPHKWVPQIVS